MTQPLPNAAPKKSQWWVWMLAALGGLVILFPVATALAIYGVRKYLIQAKTAEARAASTQIAATISQCASQTPARRALPPTAHAIPPSLESVRGMKYQSSPAEWNDEAYSCGHFVLVEPQYFQYQWVRTSVTRGLVRSVADLDGDATPDFTFEQEVTCSESGSCTVGAFVQRDGPQ
jgi:hypothetical protein